MRTALLLFCCTVFMASGLPLLAQAPIPGAAPIEQLLAEKKYGQADQLLQSRLAHFLSGKQPDSLVAYLSLVGRVKLEQEGTEQAAKAVQAWAETIIKLAPGASAAQKAYLNAADFYESVNYNKQAYAACKQAYLLAVKEKGPQASALGPLESDMGTYAQRMGNIALAEEHHRRALAAFQSAREVSQEHLYLSGNNMGSIMWYASKTDSALLYFNIALQAVQRMEPTDENRYYRPAVLQNNMAAIYGSQGKTTEAIAAMEACIRNIKAFLATKGPHPKKKTAVLFQFEAADNLAGFYKELGNYRRARELLLHSYEQKQKTLAKNDPDIFKSQVLLGQLYYTLKEHAKAEEFLNRGLEGFAKADGDFLFWQADAYNTLALLYDARKEAQKAALYYEKADALYQESLQGSYDDIYLDFLRNAALFYAQNGESRKALEKANRSYQYVVEAQGSSTLQAFYQLLNLAEVQAAAGNFREALSYSKKSLDVVNGIIGSGSNLLDSIKMELNKPKAILVKAKSEYALLSSKDAASLRALLHELNEALALLEKRKQVIGDARDVNLLMADHAELLEFAKQVTADLYHTTGRQTYADQLISLHESGLYNRIRSRLSKSGTVRFSDLPAGMEKKEEELQAALSAALNSPGSHDQQMQAYLRAMDNWNRHLSQLRTAYPHYYKMRYASIFHSLGEMQGQFPEQTTLVRYFFVGNRLMALVADRQQKHLVQLPAAPLAENIALLGQSFYEPQKTGQLLEALYRQLWAPLSRHIRYRKVIVIPDGVLYNFNFELLTPQPISGFEELATKSLLARYTISYQYSLFLPGQKEEETKMGHSFVAFAPGFSDQIKNEYRAALPDTAEPDNGYLSLLPQPFTVDLAAKVQKLLGGRVFVNDQSTLSSFRNHAGGHQIIHIGTHAESDNLHPEFSRLIFAKDAAAKEDNSLYLFDIYNCNLASRLAVLTACESGRPGYEDGEGMISLAHAFNYAGSESIVTGLWKIDEQASALLMDLFYKHLLKGLPKDEALRQAKLAYLGQVNGRMLAPPYWAGLVLMGDASPVHLEAEGEGKIWLLLGAGLLFLFLFFVLRRLT